MIVYFIYYCAGCSKPDIILIILISFPILDILIRHEIHLLLFDLQLSHFLILFLAIFAFSFFLRKYTKYGRRLNSIGGNSLAAYLSGINVDLHVISIYTLSGLIVGFAALILISRLGMVQADVGANLALQALAAAIIGGITFEGGRGSLVGAFFGVLLLGILSNSLNIIGVSSFTQTIILGAIIVIATVLSNIGRMRR